MDKVNSILKEKSRTDLPEFRSGDHIKVYVSIIEGDKERIQPFEGDVISVRGNGLNKSFTVRKISSGVGVERIFRFSSPKISKIEILKKGDIRRAKLYYLRNLSGKAARIKDKKSQ